MKGGACFEQPDLDEKWNLHLEIGRDIAIGYHSTDYPGEFALDGHIPLLVWVQGNREGVEVSTIQFHR